MSIIENNDFEIKNIPGYEGLYQATSKGNIISLPKKVKTKNGYRLTKLIILRPCKNIYGYLQVVLYKDCKPKTFTVHSLIALTFIGERLKKYQINHKDFNKINNCFDNLEYVTSRENCTHYYNSKKTISNYTGVSLDNRTNMWFARLRIGKILYHLGSFKLEIDAANAYQNCLKLYLVDQSIDSIKQFFRPKKAKKQSGIKGIYWRKNSNSWLVQPKINGIRKYIGSFKDLSMAIVSLNLISNE